MVVGSERPAFSLIAVDDSPTDPALAAGEHGARPASLAGEPGVAWLSFESRYFELTSVFGGR